VALRLLSDDFLRDHIQDLWTELGEVFQKITISPQKIQNPVSVWEDLADEIRLLIGEQARRREEGHQSFLVTPVEDDMGGRRAWAANLEEARQVAREWSQREGTPPLQIVWLDRKRGQVKRVELVGA
jgi:hypothetical protein